MLDLIADGYDVSAAEHILAATLRHPGATLPTVQAVLEREFLQG